MGRGTKELSLLVIAKRNFMFPSRSACAACADRSATKSFLSPAYCLRTCALEACHAFRTRAPLRCDRHRPINAAASPRLLYAAHAERKRRLPHALRPRMATLVANRLSATNLHVPSDIHCLFGLGHAGRGTIVS